MKDSKKGTASAKRSTKTTPKPRGRKKSAPEPKATAPKEISGRELLLQAITQNAPSETIGKITEYLRGERDNDAKTSCLRAIAEFQNEIEHLPKVKEGFDENGNSFWYSPLPIIKDTIQPLLYKHGLIYQWEFEPAESDIVCSCVLSHVKGYSKKSTARSVIMQFEGMNRGQAVGNTMSYLERNTLIAVLGLTAADPDNEGQPRASRKKEGIPGPKSLQFTKERLEKMRLTELYLHIPPAKLNAYIKEKFGEETTADMSFSKEQESQIKEFIIKHLLQ